MRRLSLVLLLAGAIGLAGSVQSAPKKAPVRPARPTPVAPKRDLGLALINAIQQRDSGKALKLLAAGANPNAMDRNGATALMFAAWWEQSEVLKTLLKRGADVHRKDREGSTALMFAARQGNQAEVALLLQHGADLQMVNRSGGSALDEAIQLGQLDTARFLLEKGIRPDTRGILGRTALMYAVAGSNFLGLMASQVEEDPALTSEDRKQAYSRYSALVQVLLEKGADPNAEDAAGRSVWSFARIGARTFKSDGILELLRKSNVRVPPPSILTALELGDPEELGAALARGESPNVKNADGTPALMLTIGMTNGDRFLKMLLERGADPNQKNEEGVHPLAEALINDAPECFKLLLQKGVDVKKAAIDEEPLLCVAVRTSRPDAVKALLEHGVSANEPGPQGLTPAMLAGSLELFELLLDKGASPTAKDAEGLFVLHHAAGSEEPDAVAMVRLLLDRKAPVDAQDKDGSTPLRIAAFIGNKGVVRTLLEAGANPNLAEKTGLTPLMYASAAGRVEVVKLLLARGADPSKATRQGISALQQATLNKHPAIATLLKQAGAKK